MKYIYYFGAIALIAIIGGLFIWYASRPVPLVLQGEAVARQIQVSPMVIGRVDAIYVEEGQEVKEGDILARLDSPSVRAKANQAEAALKAADAQKKKVFAGARSEEVIALLNVYEKSLAAEKLAKKTFDRVESLFNDGVVPAQQLDEARTKWLASRNDTKAAKAKYEMAQRGAREEDKNAAEALSEQASGVVEEVKSFLDDTVITAPISGEIMTVVVDKGELVTAGFPILTIVDMSDIWVSFNIREDLLKNINIGTIINVMFPALSDKEIFPLKVQYIAKAGDFAVWSATKTSGEYDLKTFEVKAYPVKPIPNLRSGMSAIYTVKDNNK